MIADILAVWNEVKALIQRCRMAPLKIEYYSKLRFGANKICLANHSNGYLTIIQLSCSPDINLLNKEALTKLDVQKDGTFCVCFDYKLMSANQPYIKLNVQLNDGSRKTIKLVTNNKKNRLIIK